MHYFLREDFDALTEQISDLCNKIWAIGQEMGASCREGAETFHDNFAYEDGERQQTMWSKRVYELIRVRNDARVVEPPRSGNTVTLGRRVTF